MHASSSEPNSTFPTTKRDRQIINSLHRDKAAQLDLIKQAADAGNIRAARSGTRSFFLSKNAKASNLFSSHYQADSIEDLFTCSHRWDVSAQYPEPILLERNPGSSKGHRLICTLPPRLKAAHRMIAQVILAQTPENKNFYMKKGLGRDRCVQKALDILASGFGWASHIDIKNCFPSVNLDVLASLPVHEKYLRDTMRPENLRFKMKQEKENTEAITSCQSSSSYQDVSHSDGPTGLLQGSPASTAVLSWILQDIPIPDALDGFVLVYADDILILARTQGKRREIKRAMIRYLRCHPAGPFEMEANSPPLNQAFDFLGYEFSFIGSRNYPMVDVSGGNLTKLEKGLELALCEGARRGNSEPILALEKLDQILKGHPCSHLLQQHREVYAQTLWDWGLPVAFDTRD